MVFTSFVFLCWFLPCFLGVYYLLPQRGKNLWLTCASYGFYGWWRPHYVVLMFASTVLNWYCARRMGDPDASTNGSRKAWLVGSLILNLSMLAWFKYANLFVDSFNELRTAMGGEPVGWEKILLPIGISFFTFQSMSYTIDVYFRRVQPIRSATSMLLTRIGQTVATRSANITASPWPGRDVRPVHAGRAGRRGSGRWTPPGG